MSLHAPECRDILDSITLEARVILAGSLIFLLFQLRDLENIEDEKEKL